mmetsp:Transcript_14699/g.29030  ORF Transcript_14699/g.29030 Transcript_14699/m.29030 type:complete len:153 (-) Transcript_14699:125-583(-)
MGKDDEKDTEGGVGRMRQPSRTQEARRARRAAPYGSTLGGSPGLAGSLVGGEKQRATAAHVATMMADKWMRPAETRRLLEEEKTRIKEMPSGAYTRHRLKIVESALEIVMEIQQLEFEVQQSMAQEARRGNRKAKESKLDKDLQGLLSQLSL